MIRRANTHGVTRLGLEVQTASRPQHISVKVERCVVGITRTGYQCVSKGIPCIDVRGTEISHCRIGTRIFSDSSGGQRDICRIFIDIRNVDHEGLFGEQTTLIGGANTHRVGRFGLKIQGVGRSQCIPADVKHRVVGVSSASYQGVCKGVRCICIYRAKQTNSGVCRGKLCDLIRRQHDIRWCFVGIDHIDDEHLLGEQPTLICRS